MSQFDEADDDVARMQHAEREWLSIMVAKLAAVSEIRGVGRRFLDSMDVRLNVMRQLPCEAEIRQIKEMSWKYRRQMPRHLAPRLPPQDPVVREEEKKNG